MNPTTMTRPPSATSGRTMIILARSPLLLALAILLTAITLRSTLITLLTFDPTSFPALLWIFLLILLALLPALLTKQSPLGAATAIVIPLIAIGSYGASRLDWLRLLKDFGVSETAALDPLRLTLSALALTLLWALHATDLALRIRTRAIERGIDPQDADTASQRTLRRNTEALGIALLGALGLLAIATLAITLGSRLPTQKAALIAPLLAATILAAATLWLAKK